MSLVRVKRHCQITLPSLVRKKFSINEGDYLEIDEIDGNMVLKPVKMVHPDQSYFYTKEWQANEAEADKDMAEGKVSGPFDNVEGLIKALES